MSLHSYTVSFADSDTTGSGDYNTSSATEDEYIRKKNIQYYYDYPGVAILPRRIWPRDNNRPFPDLRTAATPAEVRSAMDGIASLSSYEDIVAEVGGPSGTLLACVGSDFPGLKFAKEMEVIEQAKRRKEEMEEILDKLVQFPRYPVDLYLMVNARVNSARAAERNLIDNFMVRINEVKAEIINAHTELRNYDLMKEWYGEVSLRGLSQWERDLRKTHTCGLCGGKGHWKVDHKKWKCRNCEKKAPHHNPSDCPSVTKWKAWRSMNEKREKKKIAKKFGQYKDGKFDLPDEDDSSDSWSSQAVDGDEDKGKSPFKIEKAFVVLE